MPEWLINLDQQLSLLINGGGSPFLDQAMLWLSDKKIWIPMYGLLLFFLIRKTKYYCFVPIIGIILVITCCDQLTSSFMKPYFSRLRPCHDPSLKEVIQLIKGCGGQYGFASSHAANSFGLAYFFHLIFKNKFTRLLMLWALMVSYSRVYLGVHYFGDVLVGGLLGVIISYLIFKLIQSTRFKIIED